MLGRSGRGEARRGSDAALLNLTAAVDGLFRRARRISPKSVHHKDAGKVAARLAEALGGGAGAGECGARSGAALAELARACLHAELHKVTRAINNASLYLDSLSFSTTLSSSVNAFLPALRGNSSSNLTASSEREVTVCA
ncbi:hypothetical protein RR46_13298 [Papilio xuthus]|uniref:Uncharacterized protein n=1 Tax=Papilio xuthus TaxID=66420 RepID=A0A194PFL6_PAPXU|nr:hypothetical protein RR46_13298 [Papilio xuthus]